MFGGLGYLNKLGASGGLVFSPGQLFSGGEQGAWYDPSDNTTMFQEAGGKTPVTAVEQAVGLILDKSVPTQTTGYYSGAFDGSSDLLSFADNVALQMGTGDFTIEFWINFASISGFQTPYEKSYTDVGGLLIQTGSGTGRMIVYASNVAVITETGTGVANTWIHYALVRNSGTLKLYRDGVETGSVANATNFNGTGTGGIGARSLNGNFSVNGYMSNVRVVKGTAVYTAPFTPPTTPLTAISGTSLLALQNNRFIDNSANAFTLNVSGNPGVNLFNPFNSTPARMVNNAYQFTSASRPTLRARYNLLERSEELGNAYWTVLNGSISSNATAAPDGATTADKLVENSTNGVHTVYRTNLVAGTYTLSFFAKAAERNTVQLEQESGGNSRFELTGAGTATALGANTATIQAVGNGWYRCSSTFTTTAAWGAYFLLYNGNRSYAGDGTSGLFIWGAQLTNPAVFPSNTYQRIAAATDYATGAAFPQYLAFDGTDDSLLTANVDFSGTNKMTVFSGLSKLSDAASSVFLELSADTNAFAGSFVKAPSSNSTGNLGNQYGFLSRGSQSAFPDQIALSSGISAPTTNVWTAQGDISADLNTVRVNGVAGTNGTGEQGTGNFGNYPLYIGRRNNASLPFNGRIYSLIVRGAASNTTQVAQTEKWVASKTPLWSVP